MMYFYQQRFLYLIMSIYNFYLSWIMLLVIHLKIHCQTQYDTYFSLFSKTLMFIIHLSYSPIKWGLCIEMIFLFVFLYIVLQNFHYHLLKRLFSLLYCLAPLSTNCWLYFCRSIAGITMLLHLSM